MQLTIDSDKQKLADVLRVLGAVYQVDLVEAASVSAGAGGARGRAAAGTATKASAQPKATAAARATAPAKAAAKKSAPKAAARKSGPASEVPAAAVRAWALAQGRQVSSRGALPRTLIEEYQASASS